MLDRIAGDEARDIRAKGVAGRFLGRLVDALDQENTRRLAALGARSRTFRYVGLAVAMAVLGAAGGILASFKTTTFDFPPKEYSDPEVWSLTRDHVEWDVFYGRSPDCGGRECYLQPDYPRQLYQKRAVLPEKQPLSGFSFGDMIYYRTQLRLKPELAAMREQPLVLQAKYFWGKKIEIFLDGERIFVGPGQLPVNAFLPLDLKGPAREWTLAIKIDPGNRTFKSFPPKSELVIMPQDKAFALTPWLGDKMQEFFNFLCLSRLGITIIFCFLFLVMERSRESFWFLLFGFFGAMKNFLPIRYEGSFLPILLDNTLLASYADCLAQVSFLGLLYHYFRCCSRRQTAAFGAIVAVVVAYLVILPFAIDPFEQTRYAARLAVWLREIGAVYGIYLSARLVLFLHCTKKSRIRLIAAWTILAFMLLALETLTVEISHLKVPPIFGTLDSGVSRADPYIYELFFLVILTALTIVEFASVMLQKESLQRMFGKYLDPAIASSLLGKSLHKGAQTGVSEAYITVMFVDIRAFTTLTEVQSAQDTIQLLNEYFAMVARIVHAHEGVVSKFVGDGIMAVWGVGMQSPRNAMLAVRAGVEIRKNIALFNKMRKKADLPEIAVGMGINSGRAVVGEVGGEVRADFTIVGDTVNTAARIEQHTKVAQADLLISAATLAAAASELLVAEIPAVQLPGKTERSQLYQVIAVRDDDRKWECHDPLLAPICNRHQGPNVLKNAVKNLSFIDYNALRVAPYREVS